MNVSDTLSLETLFNTLLAYQRQQWTGKVVITGIANERLEHELFISLGRLVWATGGTHPVRRWQRHLLQNCGQLEPTTLALRRSDSGSAGCWDYELLLVLLRRGVLRGETLEHLIQGLLTEVLWDLSQWVTLVQLSTITCRWSVRDVEGVRPSSTGILSHAPALDIKRQLLHARQQWQQWQNAQLTKISPNLAPLIADAAALQAQTKPAVYQNLKILLNGQRTLRDIAWLMKKDLLTVTRSLHPYFDQGSITLSAIADLPQPNFAPPPTPQRQQPLIAYIDDSPQVRQLLHDILTQAGYRTQGIATPLDAVVQLMEQPPDLILLDLIMPIVNGYELCAQLRRVKQLQKVPIVILTGQDGIVDRVRAKLVGATDFLNKPIVPEKLLGVLASHGVAIAS